MLRRRGFFVIFLVVVLVIPGLAPRCAGATLPGDLCTGNPCIIASSTHIDDGSNLNFGAVDLVIAEDGSITIAGLIDFAAGNNGNAYESSFAADEDLTVLAPIKAGSKGPNGAGGAIKLFGRHISIQDDIDVSGGGEGTDTIAIRADLSATVAAKLKAGASNGGEAGEIRVEACDVTIADGAGLEAVAGSTGTVRLEGGRRVLVEGQLKAGQTNAIEYDLNYPELLGSITPAATVTPTADSSGCGSLAACGNDLLDVGEQCDDGNAVDGDCCSAACAAEALGNPCGTDWGLCAASQCDGLGACGIATPGAGCWQTIDPLKSQLAISDRTADEGDLVQLRWLRGDEVLLAALPDPLGADDLELCLYGPSGEPIFHARAPAGGTCAGKPCWKQNSTGYKYKDKDRSPDGLLQVSLKAGAVGKAKADVKGKGENLPDLPSLPLALPVTAQIQSTSGACWEASFGAIGAIKNTPEQFKGRSD